MNRTKVGQILSLFATGILISTFIPSSALAAESLNRYIVEYQSGISNQVKANDNDSVSARTERYFNKVMNAATVIMTPTQANQLRSKSRVVGVYLDTPVNIQATQTVTPGLWGLDRIDQKTLPLNSTYIYSNDGYGVNAYVVDTGIFPSNPEFAVGQVKSGYTAIADGNGTIDCNGHGTHVAGTIAGTNTGVAKNANLIPVRVLDCTGSGFTSGVIAGLDWIAQNNAPAKSVVNMSLGGGANTLLDSAISRLTTLGFTVVVAAGNNGANACNYSPARASSAITVAATTSSDTLATYSNRGTCVDIEAPGSSIYSSYLSGYATLSGTSMASPHVAGVAALILNSNPTFTPTQVLNSLISSSSTGVISNIPTGTVNRLLQAPISTPSGPTPQTITFATVPTPVTFGVAPITLSASSTSALPVTLAVTPTPAGICSLSGSVLTVTGAGSCVITANQAGSATFAPAPTVTQTLVINPAALTVTAPSFTLAFGTAVLPALVPTFSGFVNGQTSANLVTQPTCSTTPTYTNTTPIGTTLVVNCTGAASPNYTISPISGSIVIVGVQAAPGAPTIGTFTAGATGSRSGTLTWSAPASDGGSPITAYVITVYRNNLVQSGRIVTGNVLTFTLTGLTRGATYTFAVQARNEIGTSVLSGRSAPVRIP